MSKNKIWSYIRWILALSFTIGFGAAEMYNVALGILVILYGWAEVTNYRRK